MEKGNKAARTWAGQRMPCPSTVRLRDLKGLRYLARLFADPGREFHVLDLVADERGWSGDAVRSAEPGLTLSSDLDAGVLLDTQAKEAYRRRLTEIEEDIEEARAFADDERAAQAEAERDFLVRELARALRQAMARIHGYHPTLGEHLDRAIRTGTYCAYLPDPRIPVTWKLSRQGESAFRSRSE